VHPIRRAKYVYRRHRTKIVFTSGVIVGAGGILVWGHSLNLKRVPFELFLAASPESLQRLIDNPDGAITWTHNTTGSIVNVINEAHSQL
jgi:hypothetical protein